MFGSSRIIGKPGKIKRTLTLDTLLSQGYVDFGFKSQGPETLTTPSIAWSVSSSNYQIDQIRDCIIWNPQTTLRVFAEGASTYCLGYSLSTINVNGNTGPGTLSVTDAGGCTSGDGSLVWNPGALSVMGRLAGYSAFQGGKDLSSVTLTFAGSGNSGFTSTLRSVSGRLLILPPL